jgi:hypothetical protein
MIHFSTYSIIFLLCEHDFCSLKSGTRFFEMKQNSIILKLHGRHILVETSALTRDYFYLIGFKEQLFFPSNENHIFYPAVPDFCFKKAKNANNETRNNSVKKVQCLVFFNLECSIIQKRWMVSQEGMTNAQHKSTWRKASRVERAAAASKSVLGRRRARRRVLLGKIIECPSVNAHKSLLRTAQKLRLKNAHGPINQ